MPRPCKWRFVEHSPHYNIFKPAGVPASILEEVCLTFDEFEALRLADFEGLYQEEAAQRMNVSRQTFGNIIERARKKTIDFLLNGKTLKIEGGKIMAEDRMFRCDDCGNEWSVPFGEKRPEKCPKCESSNIERADIETFRKDSFQRGNSFGQARRGCGRRMGRGRGMGRGRQGNGLGRRGR